MTIEIDQSAVRLFQPWEEDIESWALFQAMANELTDRYREREMVWRGARRADWGVMSSLYRTLYGHLGRPPTEDELNTAEEKMLALARRDWRFDGMPALETMAHLQHFGAPTRLLDVSENPLIALWFAVDGSEVDDRFDSRLFAFVTHERAISLNERWYGRDPHWHKLHDDLARRAAKWGTGLGRRVWRPPAFNSRISSQNAAFLIDGVPLDAERHGHGRKSPETDETWAADEMSQANSIPLKVTKIRVGTLADSSAPVFTFRIRAEAKKEIRDQLERRYGYRASSIYSDMNGLASYLAARPDLLV